jgi:hypothetical protein
MACELLLLATEAEGFPLLLIEEPEAHLHPQRQLRLMQFFQDQVQRKRADEQQIQIIITTHIRRRSLLTPGYCRSARPRPGGFRRRLSAGRRRPDPPRASENIACRARRGRNDDTDRFDGIVGERRRLLGDARGRCHEHGRRAYRDPQGAGVYHGLELGSLQSGHAGIMPSGRARRQMGAWGQLNLPHSGRTVFRHYSGDLRSR